MFYSNQKLLSFNKLFNFLIGNRGGGKSFDAKCWCIRDFIKTGNQFVYLRRFDSELQLVKNTFFDDIKHEQIFDPKHTFEVQGHEYLIDGKVAGYAIALSTSGKIKSNSFPKVNKIIFDEFLVDKGNRYLTNEVDRFLNFYETIARLRTVRVEFIANSVSIINPYFDFFRVRPKPGARFTRKGQIIIEMYKSAEFIAEKNKTPFGQLVSGTRYAAMAIDNDFAYDNNEFIEPMSGSGAYVFTILYQGHKLGVYSQINLKGYYHINHNVMESCKTILAFTIDDHKDNVMLFKNASKSPYMKRLQTALDCGAVRFDNSTTKSLILQLFAYI